MEKVDSRVSQDDLTPQQQMEETKQNSLKLDNCSL